MSLNRVQLEPDGLVVGTNQLVTSGGGVSVGNNLVVQGNTYTHFIVPSVGVKFPDGTIQNSSAISNGFVPNSFAITNTYGYLTSSNNIQYYDSNTTFVVPNANVNLLNVNTAIVMSQNITTLNVIGTTNSLSNTTGTLLVSGGVGVTGNLYVNGQATITYNAAAGNQNAVTTLAGANTKGGVGYVDHIQFLNQSSGAVNGSKWLRTDVNGVFQIINSGYTSTIFSLTDGGTLTSSNVFSTGNLGYPTGVGVGGTVAQATNKATAVTLNNRSGTITLAGSALVNGTSNAFTLTNSTIAATDHIVLNHQSGGSLGAYGLAATPGAGSATITIRNNATATLTETPVIQFFVLKSTTN